jgi:hypothetical protein
MSHKPSFFAELKRRNVGKNIDATFNSGLD